MYNNTKSDYETALWKSVYSASLQSNNKCLNKTKKKNFRSPSLESRILCLYKGHFKNII